MGEGEAEEEEAEQEEEDDEEQEEEEERRYVRSKNASACKLRRRGDTSIICGYVKSNKLMRREDTLMILGYMKSNKGLMTKKHCSTTVIHLSLPTVGFRVRVQGKGLGRRV